jgi:hypothetical protein
MTQRCESAAEGNRSPALTGPQGAAAARMLYALEEPGGVAVLCGPAGVGKTTVLDHVAGQAAAALRTVRVARPSADEDPPPASAAPWRRPEAVPDVLVCDDAHRGTAAELVTLVDGWRERHPRICIVLAGEGRLLSLLAADGRLARAVRLRAVVPPFTLAETREMLLPTLAALADADRLEDVVRTIHEIAAGMPAAALRLAEMAAIVAAGDPAARLVPGTVEAIHRRLCLEAA